MLLSCSKSSSIRSAPKNTGFTLIELLVVIAIIGLLSSVVFASLNSARGKARDAKRMADVRQIQTALELYYDTNGSYPVSNWAYSYNTTWNTLQTQLAPYISQLPEDPVNQSTPATSGGQTYSYYANGYGGAGQWYMIVFRLENQNIPFDQQNRSRACNGIIFNYGGVDGYIITTEGSCTF